MWWFCFVRSWCFDMRSGGGLVLVLRVVWLVTVSSIDMRAGSVWNERLSDDNGKDAKLARRERNGEGLLG